MIVFMKIKAAFSFASLYGEVGGVPVSRHSLLHFSFKNKVCNETIVCYVFHSNELLKIKSAPRCIS